MFVRKYSTSDHVVLFISLDCPRIALAIQARRLGAIVSLGPRGIPHLWIFPLSRKRGPRVANAPICFHVPGSRSSTTRHHMGTKLLLAGAVDQPRGLRGVRSLCLRCDADGSHVNYCTLERRTAWSAGVTFLGTVAQVRYIRSSGLRDAALRRYGEASNIDAGR